MDKNNITWIEAGKLQLSYQRNPCDYSSLPYWKEITFHKPDYIKIFHEDEWIKLPENIKENFRIEKINAEIIELNKKKSIKERLLEVFPGFYGRFFVSHFSRFLEEPIKTEEQGEAYKTIINFLDEVDPPEISDEIMSQLEEAMDFWTDDRIAETEDKKRQSIENPEKFLDDYSKEIREYQDFKESEEYLSSICGEVMEIMKSFGKVSGYNDIFIPAMRRLSPSYEEYYQNLLKANMVFLERFPDFK